MPINVMCGIVGYVVGCQVSRLNLLLATTLNEEWLRLIHAYVYIPHSEFLSVFQGSNFLSKLHRSKALYRQVKRMLAKAYSQAIRYAFPEYTLSATLLSLLSGLSGNRSRIATEGFRKGLFNVRLPEMPVRRDREADKAELVG